MMLKGHLACLPALIGGGFTSGDRLHQGPVVTEDELDEMIISRRSIDGRGKTEPHGSDA